MKITDQISRLARKFKSRSRHALIPRRSGLRRLLLEPLEDRRLMATIDLNDVFPATQLTRVIGNQANDQSGYSLSNAGDVNGDGFDDLIIGAHLADPGAPARDFAGKTYVIFGGSSLPATITLSDTLSTTNPGVGGFTILGQAANDSSGFSVSSAGDVNGDGFDDLIVGADGADPASGTNAGKSYVIFGSNGFTNSILPGNLGTSVDDTINGTAGAQILNGADGDDILVGLGGTDILLGGRGNDILAVSDLAFNRIVGGNGLGINNNNDTLRLDGSGLSLNLTTIPDNRILGIETIDITGDGNNTLTLNHREVLNISDESNTLVVRRNAGDVVNFGTGWIQLANEVMSGNTFEVFTQGQARIKIQASVAASVVNRQIFYNRSMSTIFGNGSGNPINSIDSTKTALLPGQTTSFANYTNYNRGLNGIVVDVANVGGLISASDLQFATWDGINVAGFVATAAVPTISILPEGGLSSSTRVKIEFADNAIQNTWLRVTVLGNANTGLAANDVFYFGNAIGDMNNGNVGNPITVRTNATDTSIVRQNQLASIIRFFDAPPPPSSFSDADAELTIDLIMADSSWLDGLDPFSTKRRAERMLR